MQVDGNMSTAAIRTVIVLTEEAIRAIDHEIDAKSLGDGIRISTLLKIRNIFNRRLEYLRNGTILPREYRPSGIGRVITDSWPNKSLLGDKILKAEHSFINMPDHADT